ISQALVAAGRTGLRLHVELERADAMRAFRSDDGGWDQIPAQVSGKDVGGYLTLVQRAAGEVSGRDLAAPWLVDGIQAVTVVVSEQGGEGVVGVPWDELDALDRAALKHRKRILRKRGWLIQEQRGRHDSSDCRRRASGEPASTTIRCVELVRPRRPRMDGG